MQIKSKTISKHSPFGMVMKERDFNKQICTTQSATVTQLVLENTFNDGTVMGWLTLSTATNLSNVANTLRLKRTGSTLGGVGAYKTIPVIGSTAYSVSFAFTTTGGCGASSSFIARVKDNLGAIVGTATLTTSGTYTINFVSTTSGNYTIEFEKFGPGTSCTMVIDDVEVSYQQTVTTVECNEVGDYRYGFNSQEKDDEIAGEGNSYTAEYWQYDSRLGRRWNSDPVPKFFESSYSVLSGNPLFMIDPNGADWKPVTDQNGNTTLKGEAGDNAETLQTYLDKIGVQYSCDDMAQWSCDIETALLSGGSVSDVNLTSSSGQFENLIGTALMTMRIEDPSMFYWRPDGTNAQGACSPTSWNRCNEASKIVYGEYMLGSRTERGTGEAMEYPSFYYALFNGAISQNNMKNTGGAKAGVTDEQRNLRAAGALMHSGIGYSVPVTDANGKILTTPNSVWGGGLKPGAVLGLQTSYGGGHSAIFVNYVYDNTGNVMGIRYWHDNDYSGDGTFTYITYLDEAAHPDGHYVRRAGNFK